jgi:hypothetical protein
MSVAFADRTFIVYFFFSLSIHLFSCFQANSHIAKNMHAHTHVRFVRLHGFASFQHYLNTMPRADNEVREKDRQAHVDLRSNRIALFLSLSSSLSSTSSCLHIRF